MASCAVQGMGMFPLAERPQERPICTAAGHEKYLLRVVHSEEYGEHGSEAVKGEKGVQLWLELPLKAIST